MAEGDAEGGGREGEGIGLFPRKLTSPPRSILISIRYREYGISGTCTDVPRINLITKLSAIFLLFSPSIFRHPSACAQCE
jgi:hypothetical protein